MADRMQFRRDTAANWTAYNPILLEGELGFELDTDQYKLGDGIHNWNDLPYRGMPCVQQRGTSVTTPMSQKAVTDELNLVEVSINGVTDFIESPGYMKNDGTIYSSQTQFHCKYIELPCKEGDIFYYLGNSGVSAYSWVIFNGTTVIDAQQYDDTTQLATITIPQNATSIKFSSFTRVENDVIIGVYADNNIRLAINELNTSLNSVGLRLNKVESNTDIIPLEHSGFLTANGSFSSDSAFHCKYIDINASEGDVFYYRGNGSYSGVSCIFYNGDTIIDTWQSGTTEKVFKVVAPQNTTKIRFSSFARVEYDIILEVSSRENLYGRVEKNVYDIQVIQENTNQKLYTEHAGYLRANGSWQNDANYHSLYVDYNVSQGDTFIYKGYAAGSAVSYIIYNGSSIISTGQINGSQKVVMPENATSVRFSSMKRLPAAVELVAEKDTNLYAQVQEALNIVPEDIKSKNVLYKKKWVACGDSFTHGDFTNDTTGTYTFEDGKYAGQNKVYPRFIALRNDMNLVVDAVNGSTMAITTEYIENPSADPHRPFSRDRYTQIPSDADYITIWFGINDANYCTLGTIDDSDNKTFYGAWNVVMEWILTNRPNAKVGIVITNGSNQAFREAERQIAQKWGVSMLDMMGNPLVPDVLGKDNQYYSSIAFNLRKTHWTVSQVAGAINNHPNQFAHEYESTFIENWLRSL